MPANSWFKLSCKAHCLRSIFLITLPVAAVAQSQAPLFPPANTFSIGTTSTAVTGDFNSDGQSDLVYASPAHSGGTQFATLTILLNQGANRVSTSVVTSSLSCSRVESLVAADMNNDKRLDLVLTCVEGFVAFLFGNDDGSFQKPVYFAVPGVSKLVPPVDLNGDGYLDVIVSTSSAVVVLLNRGSSAPGTLASSTAYPLRLSSDLA